ncbi:MAG TPA: hypothetical protein VJ783_30625 [Pirellulales bacterium]|nr:hypothetical protein [Pirellulales bacterium]
MARKEKFEIDELEERIAPTSLGLGSIGASVNANDTVSLNLPILGSVSVGVSGNDSANVSLPTLSI